MDERIQKYEDKMKKTLSGFETELTTIRANWLQFVQDVRTRISLTNSP